MADSSIEWCHHTFNPWVGCQKVSAGCQNCYAETLMDHRYKKVKWGPEGTRVLTSDQNWKGPVAWNRKSGNGECPTCNGGRKMETHESGYGYKVCPTCHGAKNIGPYRRRVFCASLADVFEDRVELVEPRERLFTLISETPNLDWLLLTKRPENIRPMIGGESGASFSEFCEDGIFQNVWLGTSVENQEQANKRIPELLRVPAAVRFLSCEPLLGPVDLTRIGNDDPGDWDLDALRGIWSRLDAGDLETPECEEDYCGGPKIDWVIAGGESGPHARTCRVEWIRSIVRQCRDSGIPRFVKQLGSYVVDRNDAGFEGDDLSAWPEPRDVQHDIHGFREDYQGADCRVVLSDSKGGDINEFPSDLRVRELPHFGPVATSN